MEGTFRSTGSILDDRLPPMPELRVSGTSLGVFGPASTGCAMIRLSASLGLFFTAITTEPANDFGRSPRGCDALSLGNGFSSLHELAS